MSNYKRYYTFGKIVFITIVTNNREKILIDNIELLKEALKAVKYKYNIVAGVVLPDHLHILIEPENMEETPFIINFFKWYFSKNYKNKIGKVWQNRYYDHIIRDETDLNRHLDYIHYNPMKHYGVNPNEWKYSSFKKFVKIGLYDENWCNFNDKNKISELNYE